MQKSEEEQNIKKPLTKIESSADGIMDSSSDWGGEATRDSLACSISSSTESTRSEKSS